jgi:hypothetical protein
MARQRVQMTTHHLQLLTSNIGSFGLVTCIVIFAERFRGSTISYCRIHIINSVINAVNSIVKPQDNNVIGSRLFFLYVAMKFGFDEDDALE